MPLPKRRHGRARRDKGRTHIKLISPALAACPQCSSLKPPHSICPVCGHYGGKQVAVIKEKRKEEKTGK